MDADVEADGVRAGVAQRVRRLESENHRLRLTVRRLRQLAYVDDLTGLANRRHFDVALHSEIRRASRVGAPLALTICDVDFFKRINDTFGHPSGDDVLRALGRALDEHCRRGGDFAARYGGEEFALILPGVDSREVLRVAETLRRAVTDLSITCGRPARPIRVTVSIGATSFRSAAPCLPAAFVHAADTALYRAKAAGRNCVKYEAATLA